MSQRQQRSRLIRLEFPSDANFSQIVSAAIQQGQLLYASGSLSDMFNVVVRYKNALTISRLKKELTASNAVSISDSLARCFKKNANMNYQSKEYEYYVKESENKKSTNQKRHEGWEALKQHGPQFFRSPKCSMPASIYGYSQLVKSYQLLQTQLPPHETAGARGHWIYGQAGEGKTRSVMQYCRLAGITLYQKHGANKYFNGYRGEKAIVLHNVRKEHLEKLQTQILQWTDSVPVKGEYKLMSHFVQLQHDFFFATSTLTLEEWLSGKDYKVKAEFKRRFKQWTVKQLQQLIEDKYKVKPMEYIKQTKHMDL